MGDNKILDLHRLVYIFINLKIRTKTIFKLLLSPFSIVIEKVIFIENITE